MSIAANYIGPETFALAGDCAAGFAPGLRIAADCGSDGIRYGTVSASGYAGGTDLTTVTLSPDADGLTANLTGVLHGNDLPASLANHGHSGQADGGNLFASSAETRAGASTSLAVTPAGLAATAKGLIAASTTLYVATTGNDATGDGSAEAPFAGIGAALDSVAGKLIATSALVTIQVADGTYNIAATIIINHPDADKIQLVGNTSAETTVAIAAIDVDAKTITVAGDYTASLLAGDIFGLTGSSTSGLNGGYAASAVAFDGTNTVVTCSAETISSATVGGGSIVIKPCNRCVLRTASTGISLFTILKTLGKMDGFRLECTGTSSQPGVSAFAQNTVLQSHMIYKGFYGGVRADIGSSVLVYGGIFKGGRYGLSARLGGVLAVKTGSPATIVDSPDWIGVYAISGGVVSIPSANVILRNASIPYSPALDTVGNGGAVNYNG